MNNELLIELIAKSAGRFSNDLECALEEDYGGIIVEEESYDDDDRNFHYSTYVVNIGDIYVYIEHMYYCIGRDDFDYYKTDAYLVERKETVVTETVVTYEKIA